MFCHLVLEHFLYLLYFILISLSLSLSLSLSPHMHTNSDLSYNNLSVSSFQPHAFRSRKISLLILSYNNISYPPKQLREVQFLLDLYVVQQIINYKNVFDSYFRDLSHNPMNPILKSNSFDGYSNRIIIM